VRTYRLFNQSEGAPASGLVFLKREDAERYKDVVLWPYANTGFWPLPGGRELRLDELDLRVELFSLRAVLEPALGAVVMERDGRLGSAALLAGDCFDPEEWEPCPPGERDHPARGPLWEAAREALKNESLRPPP
jgi:hypothetical protein